MTATVPKTIELPPEGAELVPVYIDPELVVTPADNPPHSPATLDYLEFHVHVAKDCDRGRMPVIRGGQHCAQYATVGFRRLGAATPKRAKIG
jgi:hypothetical protein